MIPLRKKPEEKFWSYRERGQFREVVDLGRWWIGWTFRKKAGQRGVILIVMGFQDSGRKEVGTFFSPSGDTSYRRVVTGFRALGLRETFVLVPPSRGDRIQGSGKNRMPSDYGTICLTPGGGVSPE